MLHHFLNHFNFKANTLDAHAFTYLDFEKLARIYGKVGGFAHLATLVKNMSVIVGTYAVTRWTGSSITAVCPALCRNSARRPTSPLPRW